MSTSRLRHASLLLLFQIRPEIFLGAAEGGHETDTIPLRDGASPAFQFDETPIGKIGDLPFLVRLGGEKEKLHPLFFYPDLSDAANFIVVEDARAERLKLCELDWHVVMLEP